MAVKKRDLIGSSYYEQKYFTNGNHYTLNIILSTTLAMFEYLENVLFPNDPDRIVFAKNDYAFRARMQDMSKGSENSKIQANTLNFPFCNFGINDISLSSTKLFNSYYNADKGMYIEEVGETFKVYPITINYEGCFYSHNASDAQIVLEKLFKQSRTQKVIAPMLYYKDKEIKNYGELSCDDISYDDQYNESDWLEKNRIHTVSFGISINTFILDTDAGGIDEPITPESLDISKRSWNVKKVILTLAEKLGYSNEAYNGVLDDLSKQIDWKITLRNK